MARRYINAGNCGRSWSTLVVSRGQDDGWGTKAERLSFYVNDSVTCELNREQLLDLRDQIDAFVAKLPKAPEGPVWMEGEITG